jgi:anti-sigma-K factor RskA
MARTPEFGAAASPATAAPVIPIDRARRRVSVAWVAAAAAAGIAVTAGVGLYARRGSPASTPVEARAALVDAGAHALAWAATADPAATGATGDVVWSDTSQRGYMRFVGLAANDPHSWQYQLWIFDGSRDAAFPVDGGVFDVSSTGEVVVPILAKLHVDHATLFAVTVERPGGVVVSKRERIVVTAKPS